MRWAEIRRTIDSAATGSELDRLEDEIDAYVCAYVAMYYWFHGVERCRGVGTHEAGYIVTPVTDEQAEILDGLMAGS